MLRVGGFEQEPTSPLGFVDPNFNQACGGDVIIGFAGHMNHTQNTGETAIVLGRFCQHVFGRDVIDIARVSQSSKEPVEFIARAGCHSIK
jgi:hypothetical protein